MDVNTNYVTIKHCLQHNIVQLLPARAEKPVLALVSM